MVRRGWSAPLRVLNRRDVSGEETPLTEVTDIDPGEDTGTKTGEVGNKNLLERELTFAALDHVWKDLTYHGAQRVIHLRFFLLVIGALMAGFGEAYAVGQPLFALIASAAGCLLALLFFWMDVRDTKASDFDYDALVRLQSVISDWLKMPEFRIAAKGRTWSWKIARAFGLRFLFAPIRFLILIGFALSLLATFVSAFGIHEKVCIEDHQEHLNPVFCPYTQGKHGVQEILKVIAPIRQGEQGGAAQSKHDRSGS